MSDKPAKNTAELKTFEKLPVIFHFQPSSYEVVTPDRLKEWQKVMSERVGLPAELLAPGVPEKLPTWCICGDHGPLCDCDYM
jgi:hypothetical protein